MRGEEFYDAVEAHPDLSLGRRGKTLCVKHAPTQALFEIDPAKLGDADWPTLERVLTGQRDAEILSHCSRIVGYYSTFKRGQPGSMLNDWNRSKLGELADRQKGNYLIPEVTT